MLLDRNQEKPPFVLLALESECPVIGKKILNALGFVKINVMRGVYNGVSKTSYLVVFNGPSQLQTLIGLAKDNNQESILISDSDRKSKLIFMNDLSEKKVGTMCRIPIEVAMVSQNYTYDPAQNIYYAAR